MSPAILAGRQVNNVYVVNMNQRFSVSVMPIDSVTRLPLGQIQWGTWRWSASVSLYTLPSYNRLGSMSTANSSTAVSLVAGTITVNNLAINAIGMYLINIQCVSSNNQYTINVLSNGVLVKQAGTTFITEVEALSSNITFQGDFDALNASEELEIKRATIYNYLLSVGMPLISDLLLLKGSTGTIVALFEVEPLATTVSIAVSTLLTNPNAVPGLSVLSININSRSYEVATTTTTSTTVATSSNKPDAGAGSNNTGLIIGLTVGLGGGLIAITVAVLIYKVYQRVQARNLSKVTNINVQPKPTEAPKPSKPNSVRPMPLPPAVELLRFD